MEIENQTADYIPSKLRPLIELFQSAPFNVAPERQGELEQLRNKHDLRIRLRADAKDWLLLTKGIARRAATAN